MAEHSRKDTIDKIDKQIESIEQKINSLLEDIDISEIKEITPVDRMELAIKFQSQLVRFLALRRSSNLDEPEKQGMTILAAFQRHLRGERVVEE